MKIKTKTVFPICACVAVAMASAFLFGACGENTADGSPATKEEWQAQWAQYTYSDFAGISFDDWDKKTIVYQFSSLYSDTFTGTELTEEQLAALDTADLDESRYFAVTQGFGDGAAVTYYQKDFTVSETGIFMGPGGQMGHVLINFYSDYSVLILQASLFQCDDGEWLDEDSYIRTAHYGIWDEKADMGGSVSLKLYYLTQEAAADLTTEVNDGLPTAEGRYAVEMHDVGEGTGNYWIEPSDFRPLVLFQKSGDVHKSDAYMFSKSGGGILYATVQSFKDVIVSNSPYTSI